MKPLKGLVIALLALSLANCTQLQAFVERTEAIVSAVKVAATAPVPAEIVRPVANTFDILKGTAANFAHFCINNNFTPPGCDVDTRRKISKAVKLGTSARVQLRASLATNSPAAATVYNILVDAVSSLKATPLNTFTGG